MKPNDYYIYTQMSTGKVDKLCREGYGGCTGKTARG